MSQGIVDFECPICYDEFDHAYKRPMTMNCGHSVCEDCFNKSKDQMKNCPKCRATITTRAINFSLLGAIEQFAQQKAELLELRARAMAQTREQDVTAGTLDDMQNALGRLQLETETMQRQRAEELRTQINQLQNQVQQRVNQKQIEDMNVQITILQNQLKRESQSKDRRVEDLEAQIREMKIHQQQQRREPPPRADPAMEARMAELEGKLQSTMKKSGRSLNWKSAFIRGLPESVKENQILHLVRLAKIDPDKENVRIRLYTPATRGTCLVTFSTVESATKFIKKFNGQEFLQTKKIIKVEQGSFDPNRQAADGDARGTPAAAPAFVAEKKKVFIRNLPPSVTPGDVSKWIFDDSKKLMGNSVTVKQTTNTATCIAEFQDEATPKKIIDKWNGKPYPGTSSVLFVDYWKKVDGSAKTDPKNLKKGVNDQKPKNQLNQQPQKSQEKKQENQGPGNIVFFRNLPLEATESDLVVLLHNRARIAQNADRRNKIEFQPAGPKVNFKFAKVTFETDADAQKIAREFNGFKFPNSDRNIQADIFGQKKPKQAAGPSAQKNKINQKATNIVLVKGLPFETTINDIVAKFHAISKIQINANGYEMVTFQKNDNGTPSGRATIVFKEADGAQKIVYEFNNTDFRAGQGKPRKIQVELFRGENPPHSVQSPSNQSVYGGYEMAMDAIDVVEKVVNIYANFRGSQDVKALQQQQQQQQQQKKQKTSKQQNPQPQQPGSSHQMSRANELDWNPLVQQQTRPQPQSPRGQPPGKQKKEEEDPNCSIQ